MIIRCKAESVKLSQTKHVLKTFFSYPYLIWSDLTGVKVTINHRRWKDFIPVIGKINRQTLSSLSSFLENVLNMKTSGCDFQKSKPEYFKALVSWYLRQIFGGFVAIHSLNTE